MINPKAVHYEGSQLSKVILSDGSIVGVGKMLELIQNNKLEAQFSRLMDGMSQAEIDDINRTDPFSYVQGLPRF